MTPRRLRCRDDRGATILEFAIVAPIVLLLMFALADFSLIELGDSVGSNAAREGARTGIIDFANAQNPADAGGNYAKIAAAVNARLVGLVKGTPTVTVRCLKSDGVTALADCAQSTVTIGSSLIQVSVSWAHVTATPFLANNTKTDVATMTIIGAPQGASGGGGATCTLSNARVSPATATAGATGKLSNNIVVRVEVNDPTACGAPQLTPPVESNVTGVQAMTLETGTTFRYAIDGTSGSTGTWTAKSYPVHVTALGGLVSASPDPTFVVTGGAVPTCTISAISYSPSGTIVLKNNGDLKDDVTFTVTVNSTTLCGTMSIIASPGPAGIFATAAQPMTVVNPTTYQYTSNRNQSWSAGSKTIQVTSSIGGGSSTITVTAA